VVTAARTERSPGTEERSERGPKPDAVSLAWATSGLATCFTGMRRVLLAAAIAAALTSTPAAADAATGNAYLRGFACHRSIDPGKRSVTVTAVMATIAGARHLQMRFALQEKTSHGVALIHGGDLGQWISPSSPTLGQHPSDQWIVNHPVTGVPVPGTYRFKVWFRWLGATGRVLAQSLRTTATCRQPDLRPNLFVHLLSSQAVSGGDQYEVQIGNRGPTGATNVQVLFAPGGGGQAQTTTISRIGVSQTVTRTFIGPVCTSTSAPSRITVDPGALIDVLNRADNTITAPCPSG
jgi:CARDB